MPSSTGCRGSRPPYIYTQHHPHSRQHLGDLLHRRPCVDSSLKGLKQAHTREAAFPFRLTFRGEGRHHRLHQPTPMTGERPVVGPTSSVIWMDREGDLMQTWSSQRREPNTPESVCLVCGQQPPEWLGLTADSRLACETQAEAFLERDQAVAMASLSRRKVSEHVPDPSAFPQAPCHLPSSSRSSVRHRPCTRRLLSLATSHYLMIHLNWNWTDSIYRRDPREQAQQEAARVGRGQVPGNTDRPLRFSLTDHGHLRGGRPSCS